MNVVKTKHYRNQWDKCDNYICELYYIQMQSITFGAQSYTGLDLQGRWACAKSNTISGGWSLRVARERSRPYQREGFRLPGALLGSVPAKQRAQIRGDSAA